MTQNEFKIQTYTTIIVMILISIVLYQASQVSEFLNAWKRFTYEDGVYLYEICSKKWGQKDSLINRIYENKNTDFREFILWK